MGMLIVILLLVFIGFSIHRSNRYNALRGRVERLEKHILSNAPADAQEPQQESGEPEPEPAHTPEPKSTMWGSVPSVKDDALDVMPNYIPQQNNMPKQEKPAQTNAPKLEQPSLEQLISTRLGVWVGAVALILGAVFLIKYSIDEGWLLPIVRVVLSGLFGASLIYGAEMLRDKMVPPNAFRIAQGLCGAGFAVLYGSIYAATSLYHLLPDVIGFVGLAAITAGAILSALRYGLPIAFLGLFGGFVTPLLIQSNTPDALSLFGYLFALSTMGMLIAQRKGWWNLAWIAVAGSLLWLLFWILAVGTFTSTIVLFFGLPMMMLSCIVTELMPESPAQEKQSFAASKYGINLFSVGAFAFLMFLIPQNSFDAYAWAMSFAVSIAAVTLTKFRPATYGRMLIPLQLVMMLLVYRTVGDSWSAAGSIDFIAQILFLLGGFTVLFAGAGVMGLAANANRGGYAWLTSSTLLSSYVIAYSKLKGLPTFEVIKYHYDTVAGSQFSASPVTEYFWQKGFVWGLGALALSSLLIYLAEKEEKSAPSQAGRSDVLAALSVGATALISFSIIQILPADTWAVGLAFQALATVWIHSRTDITSLPYLVKLLCIGIVLENIFHIIGTSWDLFTFGLLSQIDAATLALGYILPSAILLAATRLINAKEDRLLCRTVLYTGSLLGILGIAHGLTYVFGTGESLSQNMIVTSLLLGAGALGLRLTSSQYDADLIRPITYTLLLAGCWRLVVYHLFFANPLFSVASVGVWPIINAASLGYVLPIIPLHVTAQKLGLYDKWNMILKGFFTFLFLFGTGLVIRQLFHGGIIGLSHVSAGMGEELCYSALGLATGLGMLALAMHLKDMAWRWLSLIVIILTVGKVFMVDVSQLGGLLRVLAFIGLGLSLFALSAFYSRYIFRKDD